MATGSRLNDTLQDFIKRQPLFFVAMADRDGRVNMSTKGLGSLRVVSDTCIRWLNLSGSGNETAAHVAATGWMTLMFCAFEGDALILRVYGQARVLHPRHLEWEGMAAEFPPMAGSRQIFDLAIGMVQSSCGSGVPVMNFKYARGETELLPFYADMGPAGVQDYWQRRNLMTVDGTPTGIFQDI